LYIFLLKKERRILAKLVGLLAGCGIGCKMPERIFLPHPNGIYVDTNCILGNDVVLLHQVTIGGAKPYHRAERTDPTKIDPI
jgi:serine acetyltransferase